MRRVSLIRAIVPYGLDQWAWQSTARGALNRYPGARKRCNSRAITQHPSGLLALKRGLRSLPEA